MGSGAKKNRSPLSERLEQATQGQDRDIGLVIDAFQENEGNRPMRSYTPGSKNKGNLGKVGTYREAVLYLRSAEGKPVS